MKINLRQTEVFSYVKVGKTITIDLKDFLPGLLKDLKKNFTYDDNELSKITSVAKLKNWINLKQKEKSREDYKKYARLTDAQMEAIDEDSYYDENIRDWKERSSRSYVKETRFMIEGISSGFDQGTNLISWLNLKRKMIIVDNSSLDEFLNNSESYMKTKDHCDESWLEMVDDEGQLLEKSRD